MKKEIWKDIKGYENKYQVSNKGRIKRLSYKRGDKVYPDKIIKQDYTQGFPTVLLFKEDKSKKFLVSLLVANAFLEKSEKACRLKHIDGVLSNNNSDNLKWSDWEDVEEETKEKVATFDEISPVIEVYEDGKFLLSGKTSREVAELLIDGEYTKNKNLETVSRGVRKALQKGKEYIGLTFKETYEKRYLLRKDNQNLKLFDTIEEMADWLLTSGALTDVKKDTVIRNIRKAIKENKTYHNFEIIDNN